MYKSDFHCYVPNVSLNKMVTYVYVICLLEYQFVIRYEYISSMINMNGNEVLKNSRTEK